MNKKELIKLKNGSEKAFEKIYNKYYKLIKQVCFFECQDNNIAEDLSQETFIKLWNNKEKIDPNKNIKYYLTTIAKNSCIDYLRKQNKVKTDYFDTLGYNTEFSTLSENNEVMQDEVFDTIKQHLDKESYEILILHYVHNLKYREIAQIKNKTTSSITNKASRALKSLKEKLK